MLFSIGLFFAKKTPKLLLAILTIVNIIMVFFVMNGSTHESNAYAELYLVEYRFNQSSDITSALSSQYSSKHDDNSIEDFIMRVGFMGVCIDFGDDDMKCGYTSDMDYTYDSDVPSFSVSSSSSSSSNTTSAKTSLDLFDLAYDIQNKTVDYHIFIAELIILLGVLLVQLYNIIAFLPFQAYATIIAIFGLISFWIILCISISWILIVCDEMIGTGSAMTMNILEFSGKNNRTQGVLWAIFSLTIIQLCYYTWLLVKKDGVLQQLRNKKAAKGKDVEKDTGSMSDSVLSSMTTLRGTL